MSTPRHQRISELFLAASELGPDECRTFLDRECAGDPDLRADVESLLAQEARSSNVLDQPLAQGSDLRAEVERAIARGDSPAGGDGGEPTTDSAPPRIGDYRMLRRLGEGGMGEVWEAEQSEPLRRRVAVKIIKWGMDTREVVARFETERKALALMDHPNIATVLDAGATDQGRPYFVMEYVEGVSITEHCDRHRVDTRQRLELFMKVCDGVQHAHQKAILHRDIKPSNVLVTFQGGEATPKIIDFGVAKATAQRLTERTVYTELGQFVGTPEYMSPEQAERTLQDVDTRTDVYSLGVLLYQLLVGELPFDTQELRSEGLDGIRRRIRDEDPPKPSRRVTIAGKAATETATLRRTDPPSLTRQLRGDLDWITMKAMEKDRSRRYASPSELAADLRRHLADEPVEAGPPGAAYRVRKFIRRHRTGVGAAAVVALSLLVAVVGITVGWIRSVQSEQAARRDAETARQVSDFLEGLFQVSDPGEARGNSVTAREILDRGTEEIGQELAGQPLVQARMMGTMGRVYRNLGLYERAEPLLREALDIRRAHLGVASLGVADSLGDLGTLYWQQGDLKRARQLIEEALRIREDLLGDEDEKVAESLHDLAVVSWTEGDYMSAKELLDRSLEAREAALPPDHPDIAESLNVIGAWHYRAGDYESAGDCWQRAVRIQEESLGGDHPTLAMTLNNLALVRQRVGDYDAARTLFERSTEIQEKSLGPDHLNLAGAYNNLGELLLDLGEHTEAKGWFERAVAIQEAHGAAHPEMGRFTRNLGRVALLEQRYDEAEGHLARSLELLEGAMGAESPEVAWSVKAMGDLQAARGRHDEAERDYRRALAIWDENLGPDNHATGVGLLSLATLYAAQDRRSEAEELLERSLEILERTTGPASPDVARARQLQAELRP